MSELQPDELDLLVRRFKDATRERMKRLRLATPREALRARSSRIAAGVRELPEFTRARTVLSYVSVQGEADTSSLEDDVRARGGRWILPRVEGERLALHVIPKGAVLRPGAFGIPEPSPDLPEVAPEEVDFVLVPALAVDEQGHRIGWGGGFYDRTLPSLSCAFRCAVVYDFQLLAEVPSAAHDAAMDAVVSENARWSLGRE